MAGFEELFECRAGAVGADFYVGLAPSGRHADLANGMAFQFQQCQYKSFVWLHQGKSGVDHVSSKVVFFLYGYRVGRIECALGRSKFHAAQKIVTTANGNSSQPVFERRIAAKSPQGPPRAQKDLLAEVFQVLRVVGEARSHAEDPALVTPRQFGEGCIVSSNCGDDKLFVCWHGGFHNDSSFPFDPAAEAGEPLIDAGIGIILHPPQFLQLFVAEDRSDFFNDLSPGHSEIGFAGGDLGRL